MGIYRKFIGLLLVTLTLALVSNSVCSASFIVEDGKANAEIIISPEPTRTVKLAANELQLFIKKISGAELPILNKPSGDAAIKIYLGESEYTKKLGLLDKEYKFGSYRIASGKDYLAFVGNDKNRGTPPVYPKNNNDIDRAIAEWNKVSGGLWTRPFRTLNGRIRKRGFNKNLGIGSGDKRGTLNGVYNFLRSLGVRWYFPGELGECIPEMKSVKLPEVNKEVKPDFSMRIIGGASYHISRVPGVWRLRLGYGRVNLTGMHGVVHILRAEKTSEKHPEWYLLKNGKREAKKHGRPCLSAQGLREEMIKYGKYSYDMHNVDVFSVTPTDGYTSICQCDLCKGKGTPKRGYRGSLSDYAWDYANEIATALYKSHPDKKVQCNSYNTYVKVPLKIKKLPPNMTVMFQQNRHKFGNPKMRKQFIDLRKSWLEKLPGEKPLSNHDNYSGMGSSPFPIFVPHIIAEDIRSLKGISYGDYIEENSRNKRGENAYLKFAVLHLNIYVTFRCMWDADLDIDKLLEEYYVKFYGPAAEEMKTFIEFCEANWQKMTKDPKPIEEALGLIETAKKAVDKDSIYGKRVYLVDTYLDKLREVKDKVAVGRTKNPPAVMVDHSGKDLSVKLDGKFEEDFWKDAKTYYLHEARTGKEPKFSTSFRTIWKDDKLYFAIHCEEDDTKNLNIGTTKNEDTAIWNGDTLEIFIETQNHAFYQIALNPAGALIDADYQYLKLRTKWSSEAKLAVDTGKDYWNVEIEFPIAGERQEEDLPDLLISGSKPTKDNPWHINIGRGRIRDNGENEFSMFGVSDIKGKLFLNRKRFCPFYIEE